MSDQPTEPNLELEPIYCKGYTKESVHAVLQHIKEEIYLAYCLKADDANYEQYKKIKVYIESVMK